VLHGKGKISGYTEYDSLPGLRGQIRTGCITTAKLGSRSYEEHHRDHKELDKVHELNVKETEKDLGDNFAPDMC